MSKRGRKTMMEIDSPLQWDSAPGLGGMGYKPVRQAFREVIGERVVERDFTTISSIPSRTRSLDSTRRSPEDGSVDEKTRGSKGGADAATDASGPCKEIRPVVDQAGE